MFAGPGSRNKPLKNEDYSGGGIITKARRCREKIPDRKEMTMCPFFSLTAIVYLLYRRSSLLMVCNIRSLLFDAHKWNVHSHSTKLALQEFSNGRVE